MRAIRNFSYPFYKIADKSKLIMRSDKSNLEKLIGRFATKDALVGIIGLGYVGLPLALRYNNVGFRVLGIDNDPSKVTKLQDGKSYIKHISEDSIVSALNSGLAATTDFSRSAECDAIIICVPTPLNKYREPDLSYVVNTLEAVQPYLRAGQIVSLESTTYPGTTEEELLPRIEATGNKVG